MKHKLGDKVRIKSLDWYNQNKDEDGVVRCGDKVFDNYMSVFCGSIVTICGVYPYCGYDVREDMQCRTWTDSMFEDTVDEPQEKMEFETQVCTTMEQSERLLALGLKRETADCVIMYYDGWHIGEAEHFDFDKDPVTPAWSLHRLMKIGNFVNIGFLNIDKMYECCITMLEGQIRGGIINEKYLEEK